MCVVGGIIPLLAFGVCLSQNLDGKTFLGSVPLRNYQIAVVTAIFTAFFFPFSTKGFFFVIFNL